ncbi:hypothetical protein ASD56_03395 [Microbacterium sp. Root166]|uniref:cytochrome b/b6 domain-containing protein n=1 Tax=Microbacterium sp. Root166 TaxID=1736478 RepID=UPI0006FC71AD|nr:cytochrome b/b6 domain-containing protein [Microbacterium sp. Root166]KQZ85399.1 hypothetical protein ASD56_03395 [Microbacterium sp. Root166]
MATFETAIRRGLPRTPGGEPWPPAGAAPAPAGLPDGNGSTVAEPVSETVAAASTAVAASAAPVDDSRSSAQSPQTDLRATPETATAARPIRRGLPRVAGGEPWPPAGAGSVASADAAAPAAAASEPVGAATAATEPAATAVTAASAATVPSSAPAPAAPSADTGPSIRRGLPRTPGGEAWPPPGLVAAKAVEPAAEAPAATAPAVGQPATAAAPAAGELSTDVAAGALSDEGAEASVPAFDVSTPLPFTRAVWAGRAASYRPEPKPEPTRIGPFTKLQWAGAVIVGGGGLLFAGLMAVFAVRWLLSTDWGVDFLATYPGEYHLPEGAPVGFPAWLGWQHFFNVFLMVLIIRSGLRVRSEKRPSVFWSPRGNKRRKISLTLWFHQALDLLWVVNGVLFVVLLVITGQWMRIVPTSWEVFPNAVSAALQYVSLDWPTENGWVNYNSLQQLAYFATVFIAAPLAVITGVRMSGIWPKNAKTLNRVYPVEWARAVHFPVMLYFVAFIFVHVVLVFATGALRNLNHMYAAQGSVDPDAYMMNWTGFWIFAVSMLVIVAAWVAARPLVLAPIARLFGNVSGR